MGWLTFLLCLLCLNRPDFVFFVVPLGLLVLWNIRNWHQAGSVLVGSLPALAWLLFALIYYENVVPNTAYAKLGVYATARLALQQGWQYLLDWLRYDMLAAGSTLLFMLLAVFIPRRSAPLIACISGIVLYFLWIIWEGGDFMRGRLFMPVFVAALFSGILWIDANLRSAHLRDIVARWGIFLLLTFFAANQIFTPDPGATISEAGIVDERAYYPGYHLENYMQYGFIGNPYLSLGFAEDLKAFAEKCGPFVFHDRNPGTWGYLVGPKITIIDTLGLTDAYIAKLPREYVISPTPRPGHADKAVPDAYYQERGAISLYPDWRAAVSALDCNFPHQKD